MQTVVTSAPIYQPVSLLDMRRYCRIEETDTTHDETLAIIRAAITKEAEKLTFRSFVQRTYRSYMDCWPLKSNMGTVIELPFPPLVSVSSIQYRDLDGNLQTLATDKYVTHAWREPGLIVPAWNVSWPSVRMVPDAIQVDFIAGYSIGSPADENGHQQNVPPNLKLWLAAKALTIFDKRDQLVLGTIVNGVPRDFSDGLLDDLVVGTRIA